MIIILDKELDEDSVRMSLNMRQMADFIIELDGDSYKIIKDRETNLASQSFPIEEAPEEIKQRVIRIIKFRDDVSTDD